ncbi:O-methyltransferase [Flavitalea antarctica]
MYSPVRLAFKYLRYYIHSSNSRGHGIHSPFVFDFIKNVLNDRSRYSVYDQIESERKIMLRDHSLLHVTDFGAGSGHTKTKNRRVSEIAKHALKPPKYAKLLFRMAAYFKPETMMELGTSLGTTTAYLALARPSATVLTFEGSDEIAAYATQLFKKLGIKNISQINGNFDDTIPPTLTNTAKVDFIFIDGNHRFEPTINYFQQLLPAIHEYSIVIMDDIHWSGEMEKAWDYCRVHAAVTMSIDLFFVGILLFRKEFRVPQHFSIRF